MFSRLQTLPIFYSRHASTLNGCGLKVGLLNMEAHVLETTDRSYSPPLQQGTLLYNNSRPHTFQLCIKCEVPASWGLFQSTYKPDFLSLWSQNRLVAPWTLPLLGVHSEMLQWCPTDEAWDSFELQLQQDYELIRIGWLDWRFHRSQDLVLGKIPGQPVGSISFNQSICFGFLLKYSFAPNCFSPFRYWIDSPFFNYSKCSLCRSANLFAHVFFWNWFCNFFHTTMGSSGSSTK